MKGLSRDALTISIFPEPPFGIFEEGEVLGKSWKLDDISGLV
jgi:hypothetical protein